MRRGGGLFRPPPGQASTVIVFPPLPRHPLTSSATGSGGGGAGAETRRRRRVVVAAAPGGTPDRGGVKSGSAPQCGHVDGDDRNGVPARRSARDGPAGLVCESTRWRAGARVGSMRSSWWALARVGVEGAAHAPGSATRPGATDAVSFRPFPVPMPAVDSPASAPERDHGSGITFKRYAGSVLPSRQPLRLDMMRSGCPMREGNCPWW